MKKNLVSIMKALKIHICQIRIGKPSSQESQVSGSSQEEITSDEEVHSK